MTRKKEVEGLIRIRKYIIWSIASLLLIGAIIYIIVSSHASAKFLYQTKVLSFLSKKYHAQFVVDHAYTHIDFEQGNYYEYRLHPTGQRNREFDIQCFYGQSPPLLQVYDGRNTYIAPLN